MSWVLVRECGSLEDFLDHLALGEGRVRLQVVQSARGPEPHELHAAYPIVRCVLSALVRADAPRLLRYVEEADLPSHEGATSAGREFARRIIAEGCIPVAGEWRIEEIPQALAEWPAAS